MNQFEKPAEKIEKSAYTPDPFHSGVPVVYAHKYENIKRSGGTYATFIKHIGVQNIADKRGQYGTMARVYCSLEYLFPSGRRIAESTSFDLSNEAIDEMIAELTKHRST